MVNLNLSTTILLPACVAAGVMTTMVFSFNNGMFPTIADIIDNPNATTLPDTDIAFSREWTGVAALDRQLTALLVFFWKLVDGKYPSATLQSVHFFGQIGSFWTLLQLEARREGNKRRLIAYTTLFGLLYQNISVAITIPIWCLLHLLTLPNTNSATLTSRLSVSASDARLLPWAMAIGYIAPSIAMALPSPGVVPASTQQLLVSLWQPFPLWVYLVGTVLRPFFSTAASATSPLQSYHSTSRTHLFALLLAAIPHTTALSLSLSSFLFPQLFDASTAASFHPARAFLPKVSLKGMEPLPLAEGILRFMQWDEAVSTAAAVVWAATVYLRDTKTKGGQRFGLLGLLARALGWTVVGGPSAAAVALVWARDEVVLGAEGGADGSQQQGKRG
ncbi:hypothetical protein MPH_03002 [Macrophomina phaseolina MS6]|uniref:Uncharacterized protein n=1 Tax=Macrophomina phaseolina (strain MS6) TaxID=1126212 RepID=K2RB16_MACPH|nr:hypothetical protein MPH_03002 [Macrophomina phaseolina MS6]